MIKLNLTMIMSRVTPTACIVSLTMLAVMFEQHMTAVMFVYAVALRWPWITEWMQRSNLNT